MGATPSRQRRQTSTFNPPQAARNNSASQAPANPSQSTTRTGSAPGAYLQAGGPRSQRFYVTIPRGIKPGDHFRVMVSGQEMMVRCPDNVRPGDRIIVTPPSRRVTDQQYIVTVPPNVRPGQQFKVQINNKDVLVTCPPNVHPNQRITFSLPPEQPNGGTQTPNHRWYEQLYFLCSLLFLPSFVHLPIGSAKPCLSFRLSRDNNS